jgi:glycosyltransferase involved in cell wall biosynthesis
VTSERRIAVTLEQCWHRVPGGTATSTLRTVNAVNALAEGPRQVGVAAWHRHGPPPAFTPQIPVHSLPLTRIAMYEAWHRLRRPSVERATGRVDVIHATAWAMPPRTAPLVVTIHDLAFLLEPRWFTRRGLSFFNRALDLVRTDADLLLCPSQVTLDSCLEHGLDRERLRLVPWGVDPSPAMSDAVEVRRRYGIDRPFILWAGTTEPRKNLTGLVDAFRLLERARADLGVDLVLVGPKGWNEDLEFLIGADRSRVKVAGFVPDADLARLYAEAAVFCFPSHFEGFGLPVLEAMAHGAPIVTSRHTSAAEVAGDAAVLVDPASPESIAEGIERVLTDADLARRLSGSATARAAEFTWERTARLVAAAYAEASP